MSWDSYNKWAKEWHRQYFENLFNTARFKFHSYFYWQHNLRGIETDTYGSHIVEGAD